MFELLSLCIILLLFIIIYSMQGFSFFRFHISINYAAFVEFSICAAFVPIPM